MEHPLSNNKRKSVGAPSAPTFDGRPKLAVRTSTGTGPVMHIQKVVRCVPLAVGLRELVFIDK